VVVVSPVPLLESLLAEDMAVVASGTLLRPLPCFIMV